jgi:hypothetical protein
MAQKGFFVRLASLVVTGAALCFVSGCGPRGESHTIEQILTDARVSYQDVAAQAPADTSAALKFLTSSLDRIAGIGGGGDAKAISQEIANSLTELSLKAGYPARPAMAELVNQYRTVATQGGSSVSIGAANLKLLAARTYSLVASELKTTQFKIS